MDSTNSEIKLLRFPSLQRQPEKWIHRQKNGFPTKNGFNARKIDSTNSQFNKNLMKSPSLQRQREKWIHCQKMDSPPEKWIQQTSNSTVIKIH
jgi:hypothetical protein